MSATLQYCTYLLNLLKFQVEYNYVDLYIIISNCVLGTGIAIAIYWSILLSVGTYLVLLKEQQWNWVHYYYCDMACSYITYMYILTMWFAWRYHNNNINKIFLIREVFIHGAVKKICMWNNPYLMSISVP